MLPVIASIGGTAIAERMSRPAPPDNKANTTSTVTVWYRFANVNWSPPVEIHFVDVALNEDVLLKGAVQKAIKAKWDEPGFLKGIPSGILSMVYVRNPDASAAPTGGDPSTPPPVRAGKVDHQVCGADLEKISHILEVSILQ
jgi:hypothetical protein